MNEDEVKKYIAISEFLYSILGDNTEIVLHDISKGLESSVIYIKNSLTGRKIGSPATDFLLEILNKEIYKDKDYISNYRSKTIDGKLLVSSSFFIKKDDEFIGMLCVNRDISDEINLNTKFDDFLEIFSKFIHKKISINSEKVEENFYLDTENIISDTIFSVLSKNNSKNNKLSKKDKLEIVSILDGKGFFSIKSSISTLAKELEVSEVSIYKYIQEIRRSL